MLLWINAVLAILLGVGPRSCRRSFAGPLLPSWLLLSGELPLELLWLRGACQRPHTSVTRLPNRPTWAERLPTLAVSGVILPDAGVLSLTVKLAVGLPCRPACTLGPARPVLYWP